MSHAGRQELWYYLHLRYEKGFFAQEYFFFLGKKKKVVHT